MKTQFHNRPSELVLKNNIFDFLDKTYKKIRGKAIGTKFAPPYAICFVAVLQEKTLDRVKNKSLVGVYSR